MYGDALGPYSYLYGGSAHFSQFIVRQILVGRFRGEYCAELRGDYADVLEEARAAIENELLVCHEWLYRCGMFGL